tara:strand:+ start:1159 stop:1995 length:837 start_codon:yes stop_codon:yes gene_type:complete
MKTYKFDFVITIISLSLLVGLAWYYLYLMATHPSMSLMSKHENPMTMSMDSNSMDNVMNEASTSFNFFIMPMTGEWGTNDFIVMFIMWTVMMFAMMLPSTFIFLNIFRMMRSNMQTVKSPFLEMTVITITYFIIWIIFSILACTLQYYLHNNGVVDMMGALQNKIIAGIFLISAGIFQFSNLKNVCLEKCRNPLSFLMGQPIKGYANIAYLGLQHGLFCLGCCWVLMLLLFVNGVMNLLWVVAITVIVIAEKMLPFEKLSSRFLGFLLVSWGSYLILI